MGNQESNDYNREEKIRNEQIKIENLSRDREKMWEYRSRRIRGCGIRK